MIDNKEIVFCFNFCFKDIFFKNLQKYSERKELLFGQRLSLNVSNQLKVDNLKSNTKQLSLAAGKTREVKHFY